MWLTGEQGLSQLIELGISVANVGKILRVGGLSCSLIFKYLFYDKNCMSETFKILGKIIMKRVKDT